MRILSLLALILAPILGFPHWLRAQAPPIPASTPTVDLATAPRIYFAKTKFDFGNIDEGPDIVHEFHFRNRGKTTLTIQEVHTSCGCTAAVEDKKEIPPGGRGTIKATYHTQGRPGHATKIITVTSNDPVHPSFQLELDMTVVREVDAQPDRVYLYGIQYKTSRTTDIKLLGKPNVPLKILSAEATGGVVTVTGVNPYADTDQKRSGADVQVLLPATQPIGNFTDQIVVKTDNKKKPELDIPVMGEVVGRVQYGPKDVTFGPHQDSAVSIQFNVSDHPEDFAIRSVESVNHLARPYVTKTDGFNGSTQWWLVAKSVKNLPKDSDGKDKIVVRTNDPDQSLITINVQVER